MLLYEELLNNHNNTNNLRKEHLKRLIYLLESKIGKLYNLKRKLKTY